MKHGCLVVLCLMAALWGCGDDGGEDGNNAGNGGGDGDSGGGTVLGQPSGTTGNSLDATAAEATCASIASTGVSDIGVRPLCVIAAAFTSIGNDGLDVEACNMAATECVNMGGPPEDAETTSDCVSGLMGCSASVNEIQTCLDDGVAAVKSALDALTCEALADSNMAQEAAAKLTSASDVASCKALTAKCPSLDVLPGS